MYSPIYHQQQHCPSSTPYRCPEKWEHFRIKSWPQPVPRVRGWLHKGAIAAKPWAVAMLFCLCYAKYALALGGRRQAASAASSSLFKGDLKHISAEVSQKTPRAQCRQWATVCRTRKTSAVCFIACSPNLLNRLVEESLLLLLESACLAHDK